MKLQAAVTRGTARVVGTIRYRSRLFVLMLQLRMGKTGALLACLCVCVFVDPFSLSLDSCYFSCLKMPSLFGTPLKCCLPIPDESGWWIEKLSEEMSTKKEERQDRAGRTENFRSIEKLRTCQGPADCYVWLLHRGWCGLILQCSRFLFGFIAGWFSGLFRLWLDETMWSNPRSWKCFPASLGCRTSLEVKKMAA